MKKIFSLGAMAFVSILLASAANAGTYAVTAANAGKALQITDPTGATGAVLNVAASPGVILAAGTTSGSFILASMNVNTSDDKQLQYGIFNKYSGYYQEPSATADTWIVTPTGNTSTTDLTDPFAASWTAMGGKSGT